MCAQQFVYILGSFNLFLAGIAVICVTHAENHPEHYSLVYIAISIFIFYMGTILVIIMLQIIETYQEQNQLALEIQIPVLKILVPPQSNTIVDENLTIPKEVC
ncbi:unnamed protein product [Adineta steineri]|uniref:Uncharacterized protein n=1 Tax=Adineta steineri TaxID=433720 RepID=A0A814ZT42_9BILA|nr:unnamed protein product [Adineta steineri]